MRYKTSSHRIKAAVSVLLALVLAITAVSVGFIIPSSTQAASAGEEEGSAKALASDIDTQLEALYTQIEAYEAKMDGNTVYTNMEAAYTAYCAACKAYYENYYGYDYEDGSKVHQQNVTEVTDATAALQTALTNMKTFTGYVGEATTAADGSYNTSTLTSKSAGATYPVATLGEDHNDTALYDELSGVMYTYGMGDSAGYIGPGAYTTSGLFNPSTRLDGANVNVGMIYGSVVFLYTGTDHGNQYNQTSTYAFPVGAYADGNNSVTRRSNVSALAVGLLEEDRKSYTLNGNAFEFRRSWHGYATNTFAYTPTTNGTQAQGGNYTAYNTYFFGYDSGYGYGAAYSDSGLTYRSHTYNNENEGRTAVYSNTMYFTGDMSTTSPVSITTNNSYYSKFDMLDYYYFNICPGNNGGVDGSSGKYYIIRSSRENMNLTGYDSSSFDNAISNFSNGNLASSWGSNTIPSAAQPGGAANSYIYVVDYDSVLTALEDNQKYLDVVDGNYYYRYGSQGMQAILAAYDKLTAYNPNSMFANNGTTLDVDNAVGTVAGVLSNYVADLNTAVSQNTSSGRVTGYDTVTTSVHHMILTGYDETGSSDKYNFLRNGVYATSGTDAIGDYTWHNDGDTITNAVGTAGVATRTLNPPATEVQTTDQVKGYKYNQDVTDAYYGASDAGFAHDVNVNHVGGGTWNTQMNITVYSATTELYVYHTPEEITLTVNYVDKSNATLKTSTVTLEYYKTALEAESFIQGGSKWVRTSTEISSTYPASFFEAASNGTTHSYTWDYSAVSNTANYTTTVEYEPLAVNVVYAAYSVILKESTNEFIGASAQQDGYVRLNSGGDALDQVSESPTAAYTGAASVTTNGTVAPGGATAVGNDSLSGDAFLYWFVSTKSPEEISYTDFTSENYISYDTNLVPNLETDASKIGLSSIEDWDENTTYYYYAVFTADEMNTETKHITVVLDVTDEDNWQSLIGTEFIIHVEDTLTGGDAVYSADTVAVIGNDGTATVVFDVLPGDCTVNVISDFAYGFSDATAEEKVDVSSEDNHVVNFSLSYNPLNTADNDSDIKTNIFVLGDGSGTEG